MNEVAPPRIARVTPTSFPELFSLENKRGSVTVIWACPRLGHSQNPSHDMGILCNPNPNRKGFWEWRCPKRGDAHAMSLYHSNTTPPISQRKKPLKRGWGDSEGGNGRQFILFQTVVFAKYSDIRRPK